MTQRPGSNNVVGAMVLLLMKLREKIEGATGSLTF
jgi:hypothetical protein